MSALVIFFFFVVYANVELTVQQLGVSDRS